MSSALANSAVPRPVLDGPRKMAEISGGPMPAGTLTLEEMVRPFGETDRGITIIDGQHRRR